MKHRNVIVFFLLLAFSMLQAHNFMPHWHDETAAHRHAHAGGDRHHHGHHHDGGHDHDAPAGQQHHQPFNDLNHNADFGKALTVPQAGKHLRAPIVMPDMIIAIAVLLPAPYEIPPTYAPPENITYTNLIHYTAVPLRAPPAFIVAA